MRCRSVGVFDLRQFFRRNTLARWGGVHNNFPMLLQTLRQSRTLARLMLVWLVLVMGVAVAAPSMQPLDMGAVCSTAAAAGTGGSDDGALPAGHSGWQCIQCLNVGAPPVQRVHEQPLSLDSGVYLCSMRCGQLASVVYSPLSARAPPRG